MPFFLFNLCHCGVFLRICGETQLAKSTVHENYQFQHTAEVLFAVGLKPVDCTLPAAVLSETYGETECSFGTAAEKCSCCIQHSGRSVPEAAVGRIRLRKTHNIHHRLHLYDEIRQTIKFLRRLQIRILKPTPEHIVLIRINVDHGCPIIIPANSFIHKNADPSCLSLSCIHNNTAGLHFQLQLVFFFQNQLGKFPKKEGLFCGLLQKFK